MKTNVSCLRLSNLITPNHAKSLLSFKLQALLQQLHWWLTLVSILFPGFKMSYNSIRVIFVQDYLTYLQQLTKLNSSVS